MPARLTLTVMCAAPLLLKHVVEAAPVGDARQAVRQRKMAKLAHVGQLGIQHDDLGFALASEPARFPAIGREIDVAKFRQHVAHPSDGGRGVIDQKEAGFHVCGADLNGACRSPASA